MDKTKEIEKILKRYRYDGDYTNAQMVLMINETPNLLKPVSISQFSNWIAGVSPPNPYFIAFLKSNTKLLWVRTMAAQIMTVFRRKD